MRKPPSHRGLSITTGVSHCTQVFEEARQARDSKLVAQLEAAEAEAFAAAVAEWRSERKAAADGSSSERPSAAQLITGPGAILVSSSCEPWLGEAERHASS